MFQKKIENSRIWLKKNKIFFETIGVVTLSIMAIIVSIGTLSITSYQANLIEKENQPELLFSIEYDPYPYYISGENELLNYTRAYLVIKNNGKNFNNLIADYIIIGTFVYYSTENNLNTTIGKIIQIPLDRQIHETVGIDPQGKIRIPEISEVSQPNSKIFNLNMDSFRKYIQEKGDKISDIFVFKLLKIQYDDIYDKTHTKYYIIEEMGGHIQITKEEYDDTFKNLDFSEMPETHGFSVLLPHMGLNNYYSNMYKNTIYEPWYLAIKKKYDEF